MTRTWILVADAAFARLFEVPNPGDSFLLLQEFRNPEGRAKSRDWLLEPSGGLQKGEGTFHRNALEPMSIKKVEARRFAHTLARSLDKGLSDNRYDRVILVAAPEFLGMLNQELSSRVEKRVFDSIAKDLVRVGPEELEARLGITHLT